MKARNVTTAILALWLSPHQAFTIGGPSRTAASVLSGPRFHALPNENEVPTIASLEAIENIATGENDDMNGMVVTKTTDSKADVDEMEAPNELTAEEDSTTVVSEKIETPDSSAVADAKAGVGESNESPTDSATEVMKTMVIEQEETPKVAVLAETDVKTMPSQQIEIPNASVEEEPQNFWDQLSANFQKSAGIFQQSVTEGYGFKQSMACAMAGDYDAEAVRAKVNDIIQSNPCVMFTWAASPSCKKAVKAFELMGAKVTNIRLDDPWEEGNPIRAEIGKMVGRSSVPMIFIDGQYVGGYDGGVSPEAPGLVEMAFTGVLRPKLQAVGALEDEQQQQ